jgi:hypothetical protein
MRSAGILTKNRRFIAHVITLGMKNSLKMWYIDLSLCRQELKIDAKGNSARST